MSWVEFAQHQKQRHAALVLTHKRTHTNTLRLAFAWLPFDVWCEIACTFFAYYLLCSVLLSPIKILRSTLHSLALYSGQTNPLIQMHTISLTSFYSFYNTLSLYIVFLFLTIKTAAVTAVQLQKLKLLFFALALSEFY